MGKYDTQLERLGIASVIANEVRNKVKRISNLVIPTGKDGLTKEQLAAAQKALRDDIDGATAVAKAKSKSHSLVDYFKLVEEKIE